MTNPPEAGAHQLVQPDRGAPGLPRVSRPARAHAVRLRARRARAAQVRAAVLRCVVGPVDRPGPAD
jgi:hypothetical protein